MESVAAKAVAAEHGLDIFIFQLLSNAVFATDNASSTRHCDMV